MAVPLTIIHASDLHLVPPSTFCAKLEQGHATWALPKGVERDYPWQQFLRMLESATSVCGHVSLGVISGDIINRSKFSASGIYEDLVMRALRRTGIPWLVFPGNHDDVDRLREIQQKLLMDSGLTCETGPGGHGLAVHLGSMSVLVLDARVDENPKGRLGEGELSAAEYFLSKNDSHGPWAIFLHYPPVQLGVPWHAHFLDDGAPQHMLIENGMELHHILRRPQVKRKVLGVFFGHIHSAITRVLDGILYVSAPSTAFGFSSDVLDQEPYVDTMQAGYNVISVHEDTLTHRTYWTGSPD
jgi:3',5'-cyclic AMP phosphodiesterase CpdA